MYGGRAADLAGDEAAGDGTTSHTGPLFSPSSCARSPAGWATGYRLPMRAFTTMFLVALTAACSAATGSDDTAVTTEAAVTTIEPTTSSTTTVPQPTTTALETSPGTADIEAPDGWTVYSGDSAAIAAPPGWVDGIQLLENPEAIEGGVEALGNETLEAFLESIGDGTLAVIDLLLIDLESIDDAFPTHLNVIAAPVGPITDLTTVEQAIRVQIDSFGGELVGTTVEDIAGTETLIIDYTVTSDQGVIVAQQYHQIANEQLLTVTFTGQERRPGAWRDIVATVTPLS